MARTHAQIEVDPDTAASLRAALQKVGRLLLTIEGVPVVALDAVRTSNAEDLVVQDDGSVRIPADVLRDAGFHPGQKVRWMPKDRSLVLVPALTLDEARGIAAGADASNYRER